MEVDVGSSLSQTDWADIDNKDVVSKARASAGKSAHAARTSVFSRTRTSNVAAAPDAALDAYYAMVDSGAFSSSSPLLVDYFLENDGDDDDLTDDDETGTPQYELIDTLIAEHFRSRRRNGDSGAGAE